MAGEIPESTVFLTKHLKGRVRSKEQQEQAVGRTLATAYESLTGSELSNLRLAKQDPPDLLFDYGNVRVGAELFELGWHYEGGAFFDRLTNLIYAEFHRRELDERFLGITIHLGILLDVDFTERTKKAWEAGGVTGMQEMQTAKDLVDLASENVPSRDAMPDSGRGVAVAVNPERFPALGVLTPSLIFQKSDPKDERRSDGKAAPLVIANPGIHFSDAEMIAVAVDSIVKKQERKMTAKHLWTSVDHSILIAHDVPRRHVSSGFGSKWDEWLGEAAAQTDVLDSFDEFWLVRVLRQPRALRICGRSLGE